MRRALWIASLTLVACTHEVARRRVLLGGHIALDGTRGETADLVEVRHPCGVGTYAAYVLTFGLAYVIDQTLANKFGARCPTTETVYEHARPWRLPVGTAAPLRAIGIGGAACVFAAPGETCRPRADGVDLGGGVIARVAPLPDAPPAASIALVTADGGPVWSARPVRDVIAWPGTLVLVEPDALETLALGAPPTRAPLAVAIDHVIEARGDLALVALTHVQGAVPPLAVIQISTGVVLARRETQV